MNHVIGVVDKDGFAHGGCVCGREWPPVPHEDKRARKQLVKAMCRHQAEGDAYLRVIRP